MKKIFIYIILIAVIASCGNPMKIGKYTYQTYGIASQENRNENIQYRVIIGNIVWAIILAETIIMPIYFICFSLYEPIGLKDKSLPAGAISKDGKK